LNPKSEIYLGATVVCLNISSRALGEELKHLRDVFLRQLFMIEVFEFGGWFKFSRDGFFLKNHTPPDLLI
jgi:hypothetical protein